ncbi:hypothetical protein [Pseudarthrobacter sp. SSS035]|uniref:hypothetical protein n=1 Tax=Pseudarthrobacter sp. SSS035 TaxID=2931399 RepID=UPI00200C6A62|nr:hypothetical protein [Pseudarthrobacter sp. SSS035]
MRSSLSPIELKKRVDKAVETARRVALVLRSGEPSKEPREILQARFSAAAGNLIRLRRQAHALGKKKGHSIDLMRAIDTARFDLDQALLTAEAPKLLEMKLKPLQPWPGPISPGNGSVRTVSGGLPSLGRR